MMNKPLELEYAVEYRRTTGNCDLGWHTIAAFDVKGIAQRYKRDCEIIKSGGVEYRVRKIRTMELVAPKGVEVF